MKKRVAVLISGNGSNLSALIRACEQQEFPAEIVRVISNRQRAFGLQRANKAGIDTLIIDHKSFHTRTDFDQALDEALAECKADFVCLAGFMRILTAEFTAKWHGKMINIHPSLLPSFKGLNTHQAALDAGVKLAGCSVHFVVPEMDAGAVIIQAAVPILDDDDAQSLGARVLEQEHKIYPQALEWLVNGDLKLNANRVQIKSAATTATALIHPSIE